MTPTVSNVEVQGFQSALRGMRNSRNSWDKADSKFYSGGVIVLGPNDTQLMKSLVKAGGSHSKFLRMIQVWADITVSIDVWAQIDAYKVGTVRNSCSTMNTICKRPLYIRDFGDYFSEDEELLQMYLDSLNHLIAEYNKDSTNAYRKKQLLNVIKNRLPCGYLLKSTYSTNYQTLLKMYLDRKNHQLYAWERICEWIEHLPCMNLILKWRQECKTGV